MDEFGSTVSGDVAAVPEQLRSLFNNPDEVRVQPLPCNLPGLKSMAVHVVRAGDVISSPAGSWHWHGAVPGMPATHVTFERPGDVDRDVDPRDWDDSYPSDLGALPGLPHTRAPRPPRPAEDCEEQSCRWLRRPWCRCWRSWRR